MMSADATECQRDLALGREELIAKFESGSLRVLRAGKLFVSAVQPGDVLYRLRAGWAYRFRNLADGSQAIVDVYLPGDIIGFDAVLYNRDAENVRTLTTIAVEVIAGEYGLRGLLASQRTAFYISRLLSERQSRADRLLAALSCLDARGRTAAMVLDFYERLDFAEVDHGVELQPAFDAASYRQFSWCDRGARQSHHSSIERCRHRKYRKTPCYNPGCACPGPFGKSRCETDECSSE